MTVGWGSEETQFQGTAGKKQARKVCIRIRNICEILDFLRFHY